MAAKKKQTRREYGSGSVYEKANGKWEAAIRIDGRLIRRAAPGREEAHAALQELIAQRDAAAQATQVNRSLADSLKHAVELWLAHVPTERQTDAERMLHARIFPALEDWRRLEHDRADLAAYVQTNGDMLNAWFREVKQTRTLKPRTVEWYGELLVRYILPELESRRVYDTHAGIIQQLINDVRQEIAEDSTDEATGLVRYTGIRTARAVYGVLRDAYTIAYQRGYVLRNPCDGVRLPASDTEARRALSEQEFRTFLQHANAHPMRAYWFLLGLMGFRRAEPLGMTWANVDWKQRTISFNQQVQIVGGVAVLQAPKNKASKRDLPLPSLVYDALAEQYEQTPLDRRMGLIWPAPDGRPLRPDRVNIFYADILAAAELDPSLTPHYHRHTVATYIDETAGATESLKAGILGHGKRGTSQLYTHPRIEAMRRVLDAIEARVCNGLTLAQAR